MSFAGARFVPAHGNRIIIDWLGGTFPDGGLRDLVVVRVIFEDAAGLPVG